jgi:phosphoglycolate phosphatase
MPLRDGEPHFLEPLLGVVFDLDGTLVLSRHDFRRMRAEVIRIAQQYGVPPGRLTLDQPIHHLIEASRTELRAAGLPDGNLFRFEAESRKRLDAIELEALPRTVARPGAEPLLRALQSRGFRIGLLTRASETFAREALNRTGLAPYFGYLRSRSAAGPAKPSPESLLSLLNDMQVPRDRAVFVGDHLMDAECAVAARVRFYAVLPDPTEGPASGMTADRFLAAGASAIAPDLPKLAQQLDVTPPAAAPPAPQ